MINLDGLELAGGSYRAVGAVKFDGTNPNLQWVEKHFGAVRVAASERPLVQVTFTVRLYGSSDETLAALYGALIAKREKAEAQAGFDPIECELQMGGAANPTYLRVLAVEVTDMEITTNSNANHRGECSIKLFCEPWLLGPWSTVKTGRTATGAPATEVQIGSLSGDIPGPARITLTNHGTAGQQFVALGLDGRGYASGNNLVLKPSTFDYSTAPLNGSYTAPTNEVQTATKSGTISGGSFTLTFEGQTTTSLAYNASTATVQSALEALTTIGAGNITVGGSALSSGNMTFTFTGALGGTDVSLITINSSLTGGGTAPITQTTQGLTGYVANTSLQSSWSNFVRTAAQTDTGSFQLWALVETSADAQMCRVRATISTGDPSRGIINRAASVPAKSAPVWVNLGPVHAKKRISGGTYQWQATLAAMTIGTTGTYCRIRQIKKVPVANGVGVVRTPSNPPQTLVLSDDFNQSSGNATGKTLDLGGTWGGGGDADDFTVDATNGRLQRNAVSDTAGVGRFLYVSTAFTGVRASVIPDMGTPMKFGPIGGLLLRYQDTSNYVRATCWLFDGYGVSLAKVVSGVATSLGGISKMGGGVPAIIDASIDTDGSWSITDGSSTDSGTDSALATGGSLASGYCGIYDEMQYATAVTRRYYNFRVYPLPPVDHAIHPSRKLIWQPDGQIEREASGGTVFAYAAGQQRSGVPLLQPANGSEANVNRLLIASADMNPDYAASTNSPVALGYTVEHRPAYAIGRH